MEEHVGLPNDCNMAEIPTCCFDHLQHSDGQEVTLAATRRQNEKTVRRKNLVRNLTCRNAGKLVLMDLEYKLRALDQSRIILNGIHFEAVEG